MAPLEKCHLEESEESDGASKEKAYIARKMY